MNALCGADLVKNNIFFLIIDALRYDAVMDGESLKVLMPTLAKFIDKGVMKSLTTNGQVTQFVAPSIFTSTYPLDYGGYNSGLANRPKSFVECLKEAGYATYMLEGHDIDGPHGRVERGFKYSEIFYDKRLLLEGFLKKRMLYEIKRWRSGEHTDAEIIQIVQESYEPILDYLINIQVRQSKGPRKRRLGKYSQREVRLLKSEYSILFNDPMTLIKKIERIPPYFYFSYLGNRDWSFFSKVHNRIFGILKRAQATFGRISRVNIKIIPSRPRVPPLAKELFKRAETIAKGQETPWFIYTHIMDPHDHDIFSRGLSMMARLRYLPKVLLARHMQKSKGLFVTRAITYDLALAYVDSQLKKLVMQLGTNGKLDHTTFFITGDHGDGWDKARDGDLRKEFGFRTFKEHITVPLIVSPKPKTTLAQGFHDSMSIGPTILDVAEIKRHKSFKGQSIFEPGKIAVITENCGRGNADLKRRDIFFTITGYTNKIMCRLKGDDLIVERVYDLHRDPRELNNLINSDTPEEASLSLRGFLKKERRELLESRGCVVPVSEAEK